MVVQYSTRVATLRFSYRTGYDSWVKLLFENDRIFEK